MLEKPITVETQRCKDPIHMNFSINGSDSCLFAEKKNKQFVNFTSQAILVQLWKDFFISSKIVVRF